MITMLLLGSLSWNALNFFFALEIPAGVSMYGILPIIGWNLTVPEIAYQTIEGVSINSTLNSHSLSIGLPGYKSPV